MRITDSSGSGQLRWVVLLLSVVVVLPTVCLLWFMMQAMRNERLAVRQKLIDVYSGQWDTFTQRLNETVWKPYVFQIEQFASKGNGPDLVESIAVAAQSGWTFGEGIVVYDSAGKAVYPIAAEPAEEPVEMPEGFDAAQTLEWVERNATEALKVYTEIANQAKDDYTWRRAALGQVRCYRALGNGTVAESICRTIAYDPQRPPAGSAAVYLTAQARLRLTEIAQNPTAAVEEFLLSALEYNPQSPVWLPMDSSTRIFLLTKAIDLAGPSGPLDPGKAGEYRNRASRLLKAEELADTAVRQYPSADRLSAWTSGTFHRLAEPGHVYVFVYRGTGATLLILGEVGPLRKSFEDEKSVFNSRDIQIRILDTADRPVTTMSPEGSPLLTASLGSFFPEWTVELYLSDGDFFDKAAQRQVSLYLWGGILVIVVMLLAGAMAIQSVGRQIRLNRLKNDFVATVTHELKTPLSSMRMLVDTLLEGRTRDSQQVREYLELIARENQRLSRMIDNFLTFSRMERNKQAFTMQYCPPAKIVQSAVEVVANRFEQTGVKFTQDIESGLAGISADSDAMVMVLVNLLDNAFKYTSSDKQISLRAYRDSSRICFEVRDNGRGMTRKVMRRIFDRFYQADPHLNRTAEGCGLGLSIVQFIVKAHGGRITVESTPGKGSTFTVSLPAVSAKSDDGLSGS
jgi:signal transduction histidine kinase